MEQQNNGINYIDYIYISINISLSVMAVTI